MAILVLLLAVSAGAQERLLFQNDPDRSPQIAPRLLNYQVRLADEGGTPLPGPVKLSIRIYTAAEGGSLLWSESHLTVELTDGVASVLLGSLVTLPANLFDEAERYLALAIDDGEELLPRLRIAAVPYAFEASRLQGKGASDFEPKGAVLALQINDGTPPNQGANRVHWNNLSGMPQGFADGEDAGVTAHGDLTGLDDDGHPQYAQKSELEASGGTGPNTGKNLVHWENLVGVPSGFSDGADNTGPGITTHGDLDGLGEDDHPHYATDTDLTSHTTDTAIHGRTIDAGDLIEGTLSTDRIQDSSLDGAKILDGSLSAADLSDEGGVAFNTADGGDSLTSVEADLLSATIVCPDAGYVLVVGTARACVEVGETDLAATFSVSQVSVTVHEPSAMTFHVDTDNAEESCLPVTSQGIFAVTAGAQTFHLVAKTDSPGVHASKYSLSVVYLPTHYD